MRDNSGATGTDIYRNGTEIDNNTNSTILSALNEQYSVGSAEPGNFFSQALYFDGKIAEVMSYSTRPTDMDHSKIQSYLGLKYSIELSTDYYSGDGKKYGI